MVVVDLKRSVGVHHRGTETQSFNIFFFLIRPLCLGASVVRFCRNQAALLGNHQEEQAVDQTQQLAVILQRRDLAIGEFRTQRGISGVAQQTVAEQLQGRLYPVAQPIAHSAPGINGLLMVLLKEAIFWSHHRGTEAQRFF